jgi:hypothetical protein
LAVVIEAGRTTRAQGDRQGQRWLKVPAAPRRDLLGGVANAGEDGRRAVGIEADDGRGVGTKDVSDLLRDGREDLGRRHPARHERGDPPQRRLLLRQHARQTGRLGRVTLVWLAQQPLVSEDACEG